MVDLLELLALLQRDAGGQVELGELVTDSEHALSLQRSEPGKGFHGVGLLTIVAQSALIREIATLGRVDWR
ncbi:hypothetical protein GCM10018785_38550 [Streptomyces longispororuber]|uniref:Uncharacterized protein n=1 Tax=Streptomyces longispororuber TaxID=68230 RepID=A0A919DQK0_9ACTN|nr:hypothetical protein GCM10018785_38550 [Streptomyces longispororuber]